jgi:hypothetical protein
MIETYEIPVPRLPAVCKTAKVGHYVIAIMSSYSTSSLK